MRAVPIYFPHVEIVVDFLGVGGGNVVCGTPDAGCFGVEVG